jgi:hypothetical protein
MIQAASDIGKTAGLVFFGSLLRRRKRPRAPKQAGDRGVEIEAIGCAGYMFAATVFVTGTFGL